MSIKFEILAEYIKDLSIETPNIETLLYVKNNIKNYQMNLDITSKPLKNKMIEIYTKLIFEDKKNDTKKSFFEIIYATVINIKDEIKDKKELEKMILCDVQNKIYKKIEKIFFGLIKDSGYPEIKFEKEVDFEKLYNEKLN
mgnify:FL=1|tara:strand:+ start:7598 stop:8020 length:423 start_codon:yes stop_codon:yes gene_type:complete